MCGGDITLNEDKTLGMCDYCGSTMTLPKISDEQRAARFKFTVTRTVNLSGNGYADNFWT